MRKNIKVCAAVSAAFLAILAGSTPGFAQDPLSGGAKDQIAIIQSLIQKKGAKWVAGETSLSNLSREELQYRVGLNFQPITAPPMEKPAVMAPLPASLDWRDNNGNYVSAVTDQKKCGSCWAFAMTAGLESNVLRTQNNAGPVDLSEQVMLSCSGVGSCNGGTLNADYLQKTGLPAESVYPYTATDGSCATATPGWESTANKIASWGSVAKTVATIKTAINAYGPLPTAFYVYEDFIHYKSGIYSYTTGKKLGGHAVLLVGYNDAEQYFIVKNSWGPGWGEDGFFRIAYSEMKNVVNFGLMTIAYRSKSAQRGLETLNKATDGLNADGRWGQVAPLFN